MRYSGIVLTSKQIQLVEPEFGDAAMTTADSVTCTLVGRNGATLSSTAMTYTADLDQTNKPGWYANVNLPADPQQVSVRVEATKAGARQRWHTTIQATPYA
jgi:hypothetical protein